VDNAATLVAPVDRPLALMSGWLEVWDRHQFCQRPEVLGGGCEEELIVSVGRSLYAKPAAKSQLLYRPATLATPRPAALENCQNDIEIFNRLKLPG
jgi:hypothetical protein